MRAKPTNFKLLTSPDAIADYVFKSESHHQKFCKTCGVHAFHTLNKPQLGGEIVGVNLACLDDEPGLQTPTYMSPQPSTEPTNTLHTPVKLIPSATLTKLENSANYTLGDLFTVHLNTHRK
jgi:hypothetical protein